MLSEKLKLIPHEPGSYQMLDETGKIIYVGKAKDLHKRVNSYFNRTHSGKTAKMVSSIHDFTYIVTNSELEAFLLEINLIKKYDPYYNILLRDDKTYPYIEYISKPYPVVKVSRYTSIQKKDKKNLFGPYPNAYAAKRIVNLLNRLYPLKKCDVMPNKPCLYYHINECLGYCTKCVDQNKLDEIENEILSFLKGKDSVIIDKIKEKIQIYSDNMNYELAKELKEELDYINVILEKQRIELHDFVNRDVFGIYTDNGLVSIDTIFIRNGKIVGNNSKLFPLIFDLKEDIEMYLIDFYAKKEIPKEIIIDDVVDINIVKEVLNTNIICPLKGVKKDLLLMAYKNAKINYENQMKLYIKESERTTKPNEELRKILNLKTLYRIDSFDNSNLFGTYAVSGMVVFKDGKPSRKDYRKFKVSVDKNDDYNTMKEVVYRRYYRALIEKSELPELIVVDGGITQINACKSVIDELRLNIKVCGLKKDNHHKTNKLIDGDNYNEIELDPTKELFHYLTRIQDEVHRFAITYHKSLRSKGIVHSKLDDIEGIGPQRRKKLINHFGTLNNIMNASVEQLESIVPHDVAIKIKEYFDKK